MPDDEWRALLTENLNRADEFRVHMRVVLSIGDYHDLQVDLPT